MTQRHRRLSSPTQGFPPGPRGFTSPSQNGQRDDAPSKEHVEDAGICLSLRIRACPRGSVPVPEGGAAALAPRDTSFLRAAAFSLCLGSAALCVSAFRCFIIRNKH